MRREPMEAMNVAAFWMWLERLNMAQYVVNIITYSDRIFKSIFEETLLCLKVVESDTLVHSYEIPMLQIIVGKDREGVNLKFIHNNRVSIFHGIDHFVKQICVRAFQDLIQIALASRPYIPQSSVLGVRGTPSVGDGIIGGFRQTPRPLMSSSNYRGKLWGDIGDLVNYHNLITRVGEMNDVPLKNEQYRSNVLNHKSSLGVGASSSNYGSMFSINRVINKSNYGLGSQSQILQGDLVELLLDQLSVNNANSLIEEKPNVLPNERTIFLTFSKGYPILEYELREFISRLVVTMRCEPAEAMHVAAFWMWLERVKKAQYVANIVTCPDEIFKAIFDETILCLKVAESNSLLRNGDLPMVQYIIGDDKDEMANLRFFYENRLSIINGVGHFVEEVCLKAFQDLIQMAYENRPIPKNLGDGMNVLANYPSIDVGDSRVPSRMDHFIDESNYNSFHRFLGGGSSPSNNVPRFLGGDSSPPNNVPRFLGGGSSNPPNNVPRFLRGASSLPSNVPRLLGGGSSPPNNVPRFLGGGSSAPNNVLRLLGGGSSPLNNVSRFLRGGSSPPNNVPRLLGVSSSLSIHAPLFLRGGSSPSNNVPRFIDDGSSSSDYVPRFQGNKANSSNYVPQSERDRASSSNYLSLFQGDGTSYWDGSSSSNYIPRFQGDGNSSSNYVPRFQGEGNSPSNYVPHFLRDGSSYPTYVPLYQRDEARSSNYVPSLPINIVGNNTDHAFETQQEVLHRGLIIDQLFAQLQLSDDNSQVQRFEEEPNVLPSERTIFLTFSKGYPILEYELRKFLNRSFGDIIEALHMQEVGEDEQPLYARLVVRDARAMETVLSDVGKSKFTINGKHVWARKYVRKSPHSTQYLPINKAN
uniref:Uncharacterized protein n=1 Tax=Chenopodium quinoa TaxID=63459 RepID=A0A803MTR7_CHEQI